MCYKLWLNICECLNDLLTIIRACSLPSLSSTCAHHVMNNRLRTMIQPMYTLAAHAQVLCHFFRTFPPPSNCDPVGIRLSNKTFRPFRNSFWKPDWKKKKKASIQIYNTFIWFLLLSLSPYHIFLFFFFTLHIISVSFSLIFLHHLHPFVHPRKQIWGRDDRCNGTYLPSLGGFRFYRFFFLFIIHIYSLLFFCSLYTYNTLISRLQITTMLLYEVDIYNLYWPLLSMKRIF